jgi:hypothetical protein
MHSRQFIIRFFSIALCLCSADATLQAQLMSSVETRLEQFAKKNVQEKMFVHTDREFYLAGDIAWFKIYLTDAGFHRLLDLSKVAYVEILDQANKAIVQAKIGMNKGEGDGSFFIPATAKSGNYTFRAYSNWMKNAGPDYFFQKTIAVVNPQIPLDPANLNPAAGAPDIRFFPEGGNLVEGITSRVACKVTSVAGTGLDFQGQVQDEQGKSIATFNSAHAGMGSFSFRPESGHRYTATVTIAGKTYSSSLPAAMAEGYAMRVVDNGSEDLTIQVENNLQASAGLLLVHARQQILASIPVTFNNGKAEIRLNKNKLADGISVITLFNAQQQPVSERLYFSFPRRQLQLHISPDKQILAARSNMEINVDAAVNGQVVDSATLSMSVFRLDSLERLPASAINSYLLLNSDLRGNIESPLWYFEAPRAQAIPAIDNLMLTQGWRRFNWETVLQGKAPLIAFPPEYNGHLVTGRIIDSRNGKPAGNINGYLSVPGRRTQFYPSVSDANGNVRFETKEMIGNTELIAQTNGQQDSLYKLEINSPFSTQYASQPPAFVFTKNDSATLLRKNIGMQVQNVFTPLQRKQFIQPALDSLPFYGKADATYFLDKYRRFITVEEVLREYVTFLDVQRTRGKFNIALFDFTASQGLIPTKQVPMFPSNPLVLLDGVPLFDVSRLMAMDARKIRKLDIFNHRQFLRGSFFDGVLNWQTYNADLADLEPDPGAVVIDYEGLQAARIFYSPVYDSEEKRSSHLPDFRNLLYWAPNLHTNARGNAGVNFYTGDLRGRYIAIVQGLTKDGIPGYGLAYFNVQ